MVNGTVCSPESLLRIPHVLSGFIKTLLCLRACPSSLLLNHLPHQLSHHLSEHVIEHALERGLALLTARKLEALPQPVQARCPVSLHLIHNRFVCLELGAGCIHVSLQLLRVLNWRLLRQSDLSIDSITPQVSALVNRPPAILRLQTIRKALNVLRIDPVVIEKRIVSSGSISLLGCSYSPSEGFSCKQKNEGCISRPRIYRQARTHS